MPKVSIKRSTKKNKTTGGSGAHHSPKSSTYTGKGAYYKGKGAYKEERGPLERVGRSMGAKFGKWLGSWTGTGDYMSPDGRQVLAPEPPRMSSDADFITITHREYLGDLISSSTPGAFKLTTFGINPANNTTFPWMSAVAQPNFQQYKFDQLVFEFRSFSADALNSTNTALGAVFSCINYDVSDEPPSSRYQVENTDWSRSAKPSESFLIPVECDPKQTGLNGGLLYIVNGNNVPTGNDPKTFYLGRLSIGSLGVQGASVNLGSIFVSYRCRLYKPIMTQPLSNGLTAMFTRNGPTTANPFGIGQNTNVNNCDSIGVTLSGTVMTISKRRLIVGQIYRVMFQWEGSAGAAYTPPAIAISGNAEGFQWNDPLLNDPVNFAPNTGVTCTSCYLSVCMFIRDNNSDVTITLSGGAYPGGTANVSIIMDQVCGVNRATIGIYDGK